MGRHNWVVVISMFKANYAPGLNVLGPLGPKLVFQISEQCTRPAQKLRP